ncbi:efflux RND transporter permease subunit [Weeksellaceae bacterium KMM 9713]|uniref:Efflux RND transporter permease subunit n=1 Tax=Profundicola chukchiensis TaxID=2961959 RepID=A0A9X4MV22_9FLAO|nr:efflux RND transporter permease subunit [Profundicola chukchiensis]MDG4945426.1 efflux RND transporter permease subunit [Profundicola chukchiensis]
MIKTFIERPVLSTVISIIIVLLGILGIMTLPVTTYPDIAPPTVQIRANYPGANAETVLRSVIIPIEEQVNGVEGMTYISSTASNNGSASITVYFEQDIDPDLAAVNVQNRVARANAILPSEVTQSGITTQKQQSSSLMFMTFYSENDDFDASYLQNYLDINVVPELKRINGVGEAQVYGSKTYSMRVWLNPEKMAAYGIVPSDVSAAINSQSLEAAAGSVGENSNQSFEYVIRYSGKFDEVEQYKNIVIKSIGNGQFLRLKDVANIELGSLAYTAGSAFNGNPAVSMGISQTPGSNAQEIIDNIKSYLETSVSPNLPEGINYQINYDTNEFLEASIQKVITTLLEAFVLVFLVVYIFLQDFKSTLIPAIAVPVSIIGTFFFLNLFGYTINLLTLFALILAIGIVVDDAIVVVEAVHAKLEHTTHNAKNATIEAMHEITGAIITITIVMAAVFVPVTFITGPTGVFYEQFGITLMIAIAISAVNALTLSPALCAVFLKPTQYSKEYEEKNWLQKFFHKFNIAFNAGTRRYAKTFTFFIRHRWVTILMLVLAGVTIYFANANMQTGFVPNEDRGIVMFNVDLPSSATRERTEIAMKEFTEKANQLPGVHSVTAISGFSIMNGSGGNYGFGFVKLDPFDERNTDETQINAIVGRLFGVGATVADANMIFFTPPSIQGFGASSGVEFSLIDKSGGDLENLDEVAKNFSYALSQRPEMQYAQTSFNINFPQYEMDINVPRAMEAGVSVNSILSAMQGYIGGLYSANFSKYGKQYRVMIQANPDDRNDIGSINNLYVRTNTGEMTPISQFVEMKRVYGPQTVNRFNLFQSAGFNGATNPGYSTGDAINVVNEVASQVLPNQFDIMYSGLTREEVSSGSQASIIFVLSLIFVYFLLSAQYESYIVPFSVILSLPFGVMGAYLGQWAFGLENNIYFQIALIMLIGLLAKNAILIVEFALQRRRMGKSISLAAIDAAKARLRPILMTSFAFIFGMLPLVFASGTGAVGNRSIATGAASGLLIGTIFGVIVIPVLFVIFQKIQERIVPIKFDLYEEQMKKQENEQ